MLTLHPLAVLTLAVACVIGGVLAGVRIMRLALEIAGYVAFANGEIACCYCTAPLRSQLGAIMISPFCDVGSMWCARCRDEHLRLVSAAAQAQPPSDLRIDRDE